MSGDIYSTTTAGGVGKSIGATAETTNIGMTKGAEESASSTASGSTPESASGRSATTTSTPSTSESISTSGQEQSSDETEGCSACGMKKKKGETCECCKRESTVCERCLGGQKTHFERYVNLPPEIDINNIQAQKQDGKWCICLPKISTAKPKKIQIGKAQQQQQRQQQGTSVATTSSTGQTEQPSMTEQKTAIA